jgi:hypothetical protein
VELNLKTSDDHIVKRRGLMKVQLSHILETHRCTRLETAVLAVVNMRKSLMKVQLSHIVKAQRCTHIYYS